MNKNISPALYFQVFGLKPGRGEQRRLAIVEAFIDCLCTEGLDRTTFDSVGKKLGMTRTHVAYFFANRDELVFTAIRFVIATGQEVTVAHLEQAKSPQAQLKAAIEGPFVWLEKYPQHAAVMLMFYYLCSYEQKYRDLQTLIQQTGEARLLACVAPLTELPSAAARNLARNIQALMAGRIQYAFIGDYGASVSKLASETVSVALDWIAKAQVKPKR